MTGGSCVELGWRPDQPRNLWHCYAPHPFKIVVGTLPLSVIQRNGMSRESLEPGL